MKSFKFLLFILIGMFSICGDAQMDGQQNVNAQIAEGLNGLPPQVRQLLQSNMSQGQMGMTNSNTGGLPSGLAQQKQLMQQMNNPSGGSLQNPALAKLLQNNPQVAQAAAQQPTMNANTLATLQSLGANPAENSKSVFDEAISEVLPLTPQQIMAAKQKLAQTQRAAAGYYPVPPKPVSTSVSVDLSPGAQPPVIRLSLGFVSSLVFLDSTGAPWPVEAYDLGNPGAFSIAWDQKSNTLMIQAMSSFTFGNLAVKLKDLNTPVMLTLVPGQKVVDYRIDLRIQGSGPNAQAMAIQGMPAMEGTDLNGVLDGIGPAGSKLLQVKGGQAQAWILDNRMFLRSRLMILSPGWLATLASADGMHAYMLPRTPTVLVSQNGKPVQLKIEGF